MLQSTRPKSLISSAVASSVSSKALSTHPEHEQPSGAGTDHTRYLFSTALLPALIPSRSQCSVVLAPAGVACHLVSAAAPAF